MGIDASTRQFLTATYGLTCRGVKPRQASLYTSTLLGNFKTKAYGLGGDLQKVILPETCILRALLVTLSLILPKMDELITAVGLSKDG